jgi:hypothetical protein
MAKMQDGVPAPPCRAAQRPSHDCQPAKFTAFLGCAHFVCSTSKAMSTLRIVAAKPVLQN